MENKIKTFSDKPKFRQFITRMTKMLKQVLWTEGNDTDGNCYLKLRRKSDKHGK